MKKIALVAVCLFILNSVFSQSKEFYFKPQWKAGDKKTVKVAEHEKEIENGKTTSDTTSYNTYQIEVLKNNPNDYLLRITYENVAMRSAISLYDKMGEEMNDYKDLVLDLKVNKQTAQTELVNWKQVQIFMNSSFDQIQKLLEEKNPEMSFAGELILSPLRKIFDTKENIEAYATAELAYLLFPFGKKFVQGDTLKTVEKSENPFNPKDSIEVITLSYLTNIDEANKTCSINTQRIYDFSDFINMITNLMKGMAETFELEQDSIAAFEKEMEETFSKIEFDMKDMETITFDYQTTWPQKIIKTVQVTGGDDKKKGEKTTRKTVTLK